MKEFKIAEEGGYSIYKIPGIDNEEVKELVNKFANEISETKYFGVTKISEDQFLVQPENGGRFELIDADDFRKDSIEKGIEKAVKILELKKSC